MRARLSSDAEALDRLFASRDLHAEGGTSLYRFFRCDQAQSLFRHLGESGILTRRFIDRPQDLRIGLPAGADEMKRLADAVAKWSARRRSKESVR